MQTKSYFTCARQPSKGLTYTKLRKINGLAKNTL